MVSIKSAIVLAAAVAMVPLLGGCAEHHHYGHRYSRTRYNQQSPWVGNDNHTGTSHAYDGNSGRNYNGAYGGGDMRGGNDMNNRGPQGNDQGGMNTPNGGDNNTMNNH